MYNNNNITYEQNANFSTLEKALEHAKNDACKTILDDIAKESGITSINVEKVVQVNNQYRIIYQKHLYINNMKTFYLRRLIKTRRWLQNEVNENKLIKFFTIITVILFIDITLLISGFIFS